MCSRMVAAFVLVASVVSAAAEPMNAEQARHFVVGKVFSYSCFEGTRGAGRVNSDGSVAGTIQLRGSGPVHYLRLPPNTLRAKGGSVCASIKGMPFNPCFTINKTSQASFRGSIYGLRFAYCEFKRRGPRINVAGKRQPSKRIPLRAAINAR